MEESLSRFGRSLREWLRGVIERLTAQFSAFVEPLRRAVRGASEPGEDDAEGIRSDLRALTETEATAEGERPGAGEAAAANPLAGREGAGAA